MNIISKLILCLVFIISLITVVSGQDNCSQYVTPPITDEMFFISSPCDPEGEIFFTHEDFLERSENMTEVLGLPLGNPSSGISSESSENSIGVLANTFGDMDIQGLFDCFDIWCSPQMAGAQTNLADLQDAFQNVNLTEVEMTQVIGETNNEEEYNGDLSDFFGENGMVVENLEELIAGLTDSLGAIDLQNSIASSLGISNTDCNDPSIWDDVLPDGPDFPGDVPSDGGGDSFKKQLEIKATELFTQALMESGASDPNWFLGEIEGLGVPSPTSLMPSPSATGVINSVQAGVNLYNGTGSFGLPLDNISAKDVSVPISIGSTPGGLKVDDQEGLLGSNMNLSAGGKVTRVVNGLPDEFDGTLESFAYGYKRGLKPVLEFTGMDLGLDISGGGGPFQKWLRKILCKILQILIEDLLDLNIGIPCSGSTGIANNYLSLNNINLDGPQQDQLNQYLQGNVYPFESLDGENEDLVQLIVYWNSQSANYLNTDLLISIPLFKKVVFTITLKFRAGLKIVDIPSPVLVNKRGIGYNHLDDPNAMGDGNTVDVENISQESPALQGAILNRTNSTRKREDFEFFNPKLSAFLEAMGNLETIFTNDPDDLYPTFQTEQIDLEPDEYYYDFGGYSGKFYIRQDGNVVLTPYQDFFIETVEGYDERKGISYIESFTFTTPEGIAYTFDVKAFSKHDFYRLPTSFEYKEKGTSWDKFKKPTVGKVEYPVFKLLMGLPVNTEVKKDFITNYYIEQGTEYVSTWNVSSISSNISKEQIDFEYEPRTLRYNSSKNWTHTFPDFTANENDFSTTANPDLQGFHVIPREWKNGFAELTYSVTETYVEDQIIKEIKNNRGKKAVFHYNVQNASIPGASLCTKIEILKDGDSGGGLSNTYNFYKAWEFDYEEPSGSSTTFSCGQPTTDEYGGQGSVYAATGEFKLDFDLAPKDENDKFIFSFPIGLDFFKCLRFTIPVRLRFDIEDHTPNGYYYMNQISEFGSLMQLKTILDIRDEWERERFLAESVRNFVRAVNEIGDGESNEILSIDRIGELNELPKRFAVHQDIWGYYNGISSTMSPFIRQSYGNGFNTDHFAFKHPDVSDEQFDQGRVWGAHSISSQIGQIGQIQLETGAFINYSYDLHQYPESNDNILSGVRGGLRVSGITRGSSNGPSKVENYVFNDPSIIAFPVFLDQHDLDRYYKNLERKVKTSWKPLNVWQMNKEGYVGYGKVDENVIDDSEDNGRIEHYFTTPNPNTNVINPAIRNIHLQYRRITLTGGNVNSQPPSDNPIFPPNHPTFGPKIVKGWQLGLERQTDIYNASNQLLQTSETAFDFPAMQGLAGKISCPKTQMFQYLHYGSFNDLDDEGTIYQIVDAGTRCFPNKVIQIIRLYLDLILTEHPYRYIEKDFVVADVWAQSEKVEVTQSETITYYPDGGSGVSNSVSATNEYENTLERKLRSTTQNFSSDLGGQSVKTEYFYADAGWESTYNFLDGATLTAMNDLNYEVPIGQLSYTNGVLAGGSITDFQLLNNRYLAEDVWGVLENSIVLKGRILDYNTDGMPAEYRLAHFGTGYTPEDYSLAPPITMVWNANLLPLERNISGGGLTFTTTNEYNELCQVISSLNADNLEMTYTYDGRRRLETVVGPGGLQTTRYGYVMNPLTLTETIEFSDDTPNQGAIQSMDGWGNPLSTKRLADGATLSSTEYDNLWRPIKQTQIGAGATTIEYESSPLGRPVRTVDAEDNVTTTKYIGPFVNQDIYDDYMENENGVMENYQLQGSALIFDGIEITDANQHTSYNYSDAFGNTTMRVSGAGGITIWNYDPRLRISTIHNPIYEKYEYMYNPYTGLLSSKKTPGKPALDQFWYDETLRLVAKADGLSNIVLDYDPLYRLATTNLASGTPSVGINAEPLNENEVNSLIADALLLNIYEPEHTWLKETQEAILEGNSIAGIKSTILDLDNLGRVESATTTYSNSGSTVNEVYTPLTAAGLSKNVQKTVTGPGGDPTALAYRYVHDDVLRTIQSFVSTNGGEEKIMNHLFFNGQDQVYKKHIGGTTSLPLQKVTYGYDGIGRLVRINSPSEVSCLIGTEYCAVGLELNVDPQNCSILQAVRIDGLEYTLEEVINLENTNVDLATAFNAALDNFGYTGVTEVNVSDSPFGLNYSIVVNNTTAQNIQAVYANCDDLTSSSVLECCTNQYSPGSSADQNGEPSAAIYYQKLEYTGLDINRMDIISDCSVGLIRNNYVYDGDHRITAMNNTVFEPQITSGAYSTNYTYDPSGNIKTLNRMGLIKEVNGVFNYGQIDQLEYIYDTEEQHLKQVIDHVEAIDPIARVKGFEPAQSTYSYDGNGNLVQDDGKGLDISYNLLNLPSSVSGDEGALSMTYTFGGEKIRKVGPDGTRDYIAGLEYLGSNLEFISIADGRILNDEGNLRFQHTIADHLGNTVVLFEDVDGDGYITPETALDGNPDNDEVVQRNLYYPFGMAMNGRWNAVTTPRMDYLYNGKELNEELNLNWYSYGFRMYDPAIGRFPSVDPIADQFAFVSPFNYAENKPISHIDLWGLQSYPMYGGANGVLEGSEQFQKDNPKAAKAIALVIPTILTGGLAIEIWGARAVVGFVANEVKDEFLSQATYGVSDYADLSKQIKNLIQEGFKRSGKTILGHMEDKYWEKAKDADANIFYMDDDTWDGLVEQGVDMWDLNKSFLDKVVEHGDEVILSRPASEVRVGSVLEKEIDYLWEKGYRWKDNDKTTLIPGTDNK